MIEAGIQDIPMFRMSLPQIRAVEGYELNEVLEDAYSKWGADGVIVITRSNKRANRFNQAIRNFILQREEEVSSGDMLMIVKNNYHYVENDPDSNLDFIANGDIARVKRIQRYEELYGFRFATVTLTFPDYEDYELDCKIILDTLHSESPSLTQEQSRALFYGVESDYAHITAKSKRYKAIREDPFYNALQVKFAYSVTCHKAQGGQWPCVFVDKMLFGDEEITTDLMRWLYTALTRATEQLYLVNFDERFFEE
jgi:exodeoxyribonuclease-5